MNVIVLTTKESVNNIIADHLKDQFRARVTSFTDGDKAASEIHQDEMLRLVIVRSDEEQSPEFAPKVLNAIYDVGRDVQVIVLGHCELSFKNYECISDRIILEEISRIIIRRLKLKKEEVANVKLPDFIAIPVKDLLSLKKTPCDLFIKLNRKEGEDYLKRFKHGDDFSEEDVKNYVEAGVHELYMRKEDRESFYIGFTKDSLLSLRDFPNSNTEEKVKISSSIFQASSHYMRELGLSESTLIMVETSMKAMQQMVTSESKVGMLLKKLLTSQESYSFKKAAMISAVSHHILPEMDWGNGDQLQQIFVKIHNVAFFHDLFLEEEEHIKIQFKDQFILSTKLTNKEKDLINNHAQKMATLMQSMVKLPTGVDLIVKQHHGQSNGLGFPEKLSSSISPLAIFFIVVEHFSALLLEHKEKINFELIFDELYRTHSLPSYRKIVDALRVRFYPSYKP